MPRTVKEQHKTKSDTHKNEDQIRTEKTKAAMLAALDASLGVVTTACRTVGIARDTHYRWMKEDAEYNLSVKDIENTALDFVETAQFQEIRKGNASLIIWYLKTKGRKRGYVERQEFTGPNGQDLIPKFDMTNLSLEEKKALFLLIKRAKGGE